MPHLKEEEERNRLERYLNKDLSFRSIAESIGKNPSTISREVQKRRISSRKTSESCVLNNCQHRFECKIEGLCKKFQTSCNGKCCTYRSSSPVRPPFMLKTTRHRVEAHRLSPIFPVRKRRRTLFFGLPNGGRRCCRRKRIQQGIRRRAVR